jgi:hypothetical protein
MSADLATTAQIPDISNLATTAEVPTNVSELTNDANYARDVDLANVAASGDYSDLSNTPDVSAMIATAVDGIVDGAPGTLDTLNEIAAAIDDDANIATTLTTAISAEASTARAAEQANAAAIAAEETRATTAEQANAAAISAEQTRAEAAEQANAAAIAAISVPTNVSDLTNDAGYLTEVGTVNYDSLSNRPVVGSVMVNESSESNSWPADGKWIKIAENPFEKAGLTPWPEQAIIHGTNGATSETIFLVSVTGNDFDVGTGTWANFNGYDQTYLLHVKYTAQRNSEVVNHYPDGTSVTCELVSTNGDLPYYFDPTTNIVLHCNDDGAELWVKTHGSKKSVFASILGGTSNEETPIGELLNNTPGGNNTDPMFYTHHSDSPFTICTDQEWQSSFPAEVTGQGSQNNAQNIFSTYVDKLFKNLSLKGDLEIDGVITGNGSGITDMDYDQLINRPNILSIAQGMTSVNGDLTVPGTSNFTGPAWFYGNVRLGNSNTGDTTTVQSKLETMGSVRLGDGATDTTVVMGYLDSRESAQIGGSLVLSGDFNTGEVFFDKSEKRAAFGMGSTYSDRAIIQVKQEADDEDGGGISIIRAGNANDWTLWHSSAGNLNFSYNKDSKGYLDDGTEAGKIDFTGQHRSVPSDSTTLEELSSSVGKIVVADGEYSNLTDKGISINESIPKVKLSNSRNQKQAFGVISDSEDASDNTRTYANGAFVTVLDKKSEDDHRIIINSLGEGAVWVTNINGNLENGDYITTCEIPGYGMLQGDDLLHNYTVAKITMDCDFDLNSDKYECVEVTHNGQTYKAAFVGCTYHCG